MIEITVKKGAGDKPAGDSDNELIPNEYHARLIGQNKLNDLYYHRHTITVKIPYKAGVESGHICTYRGSHYIVKEYSISIDDEGVFMTLTLEGDYQESG